MKNKKVYNAKMIYVFFISVIVLVVTSCDNADERTDMVKEAVVMHSEADDAAANLAKDSKFLASAAEINIEEIDMGQLVQTNGRMSNVKDLGEMMVNQHTKCLTELKKLALKKQIALPTYASNEGRADYGNLADKSGSDFDESYCGLMVNGHKGAITLFEKASKDCSDPDIKAFAIATLPALKEHLNHAIMCQRQIQNL